MTKNLQQHAVIAPEQFKDIVAHFATGITLVTTQNDQGQPAGLLVNSFSSVSLEPPLVLFCLSKNSQLHKVFASSEQFAVNILNTEQEWIVKQFTSPVEDRWAEVEYSMTGAGPLVTNSLAHIECTVSARHHAGDHTIYVGYVVNMMQGQGQPLLYCNRRFGQFSA